MKELIIMRHAKSDWEDSSLKDIQRPLNARGQKAASRMAEEFIKREIVPDKIFSSSAVRARKTSKLVAKKLGISLREITYEPRFYFGFKDDYYNFIEQLDDDLERVLIIGHNPNIEDIIYFLTKNKEHTSIMPTASAAYLSFEIESWKSIKPDSGELRVILRPKDID